MAHTFLNGFSGSVLVAAAAFDVTEWDCDIEAEILDTTVTSDNGWQSNITGCKKATGSCKSYFDTSAVPTGAAGIVPGASVILTLNIGSSGKFILVPARLGKVTINNPVKGVVPCEFSFESNGAVTLPS